MNDVEINLALAAEILSTRNARIFPGSEQRTTPLDGDSELVVGWKESVPDKWPMLQAALELYTWPTYMLDGTRSRFVDNPEIDGVVYPGRWRQATISRVRRETRNGEDWWIVLTLRSGYATALRWDEARMVTRKMAKAHSQAVTGVAGTTSNDPGQSVVVRFPNFNPFKLNAAQASVSQAYTDPVVYGETLTGTWSVLFSSAGKAEDGSGYIDVVLSLDKFTLALYQKCDTPKSAIAYRLHSVPRADAQTIIDAWKTVAGRSAYADFNDDRQTCTITLSDVPASRDDINMAWMENCDVEVSPVFKFDLTKAEVEALDNSYSTATAGVSISISFSENENGLYDAIITTRTRQYREYGDSDGAFATGVLREDGLFAKEREWKQLGLTDETPRSVTRADGFVKTQDVQVRDDCSKDVVTREVEAQAVNPTQIGHTRTTFEHVDTSGKRNQSSAESAVAVTGGKITEVNSELNEYNRWDVNTRERTAQEVDDAQQTKQISAFEMTVADVDRNKALEITHETSQSVGSVVQTRNSKNEFGLNDHETVTRTDIERSPSAEAVQHEAFETRTDVEARNLHTYPTLPTEQAAGYITTLRRRLNEFLRYDSETTTRTAVEQENFGLGIQIDAFGKEETAESQNLESEPTLPSVQTAGVIQRMRKRLNAFLRWDSETTTQTSSPQANAATGISHDAFETRNLGEGRNIVLEPTLPTEQEAGYIKTWRKRLNAFLRWDLETDERQAVERVAAQTTQVVSAFESRTDVTDRNEAIADTHSGATVTGQITEKRATLNEFQRFDNTVSTRASTQVADARTMNSSDTFEDVESDTIANKTTAARNPNSAAGVIETVRTEKTEFPGAINDTLEKRTAKEVSDARTMSTSDTFEDRESDTIRNKSSAARTPNSADGVIEEVVIEKSEFPDRIHDTLNKRTATEVSDSRKVSTENAFESIETDTIRNKSTGARTLDTFAEGTIQELVIEKSEFPDRIHDTLTERTAKEDVQFIDEDERTALETRTTTGDKNATDAEDGVDVSNGKITIAASRLNEYGKWDTRKDEITAVAQDTGWVSFDTRHGTGYYRQWWNQDDGFGSDTVANDMDDESQNSISVHINKFGKEDGSASRMPFADSDSSDSFPLGWEVKTMKSHRVRDYGDTTQKQVIEFEEHTIYEDTLANAESELKTRCGSYEIREARVFLVTLITGTAKWCARAVTAPTSYGAWEDA